jgi:hypothetical protein
VSVEEEEYEEEYDDEEEEEEEEEEVSSRRRSRRRRGDDDDDDDDDEDDYDGHRASDRFTHHRGKRDSSRAVWIVMGVVLLIGAAVGVLHLAGLAPWSDKPEIDLGVVNNDLVADWNGGDVEAMAGHYRPDSRVAFREQLEAMSSYRGWADGFPEAIAKSATVVVGSVSEPEQGESLFEFGEGESVEVLWQYHSGSGHWYIETFKPSQPPIDPMLAPFAETWAKSDPEALRPFFHPEGVLRMIDIVKNGADKRRWGSSYPELGDHQIEVIKEERRVYVTYSVPGGELMVKWKHVPAKYIWYISGFKFP